MRGRLTVFITILLVLAVLVGLNAASYVRVEREPDLEVSPNRSTTNAGSTGTRALFDFLTQTGRRVVRWTRPASALLGGEAGGALRPATYVIVGRTRLPLAREEARAILRWVSEEGGRLVIVDRVPDTLLLPVAGGWRVASEVFEYPERDVRPEQTEVMTRGVPAIAPAQPTPLVRDVEQVTRSRFASRLRLFPPAESPRTGTGIGPAAPPPPKPSATPSEAQGEDDWWEEEPEPTPMTAPPVAVVVDSPPPPASEASTAPVVHLSDGREGEGGALLVDYAHGRGRIVVLSDPFIVANSGLALADNLQLATNVVAGVGDGGIIAFDEYHQGYGETRNQTLAYFAGTPVLWMFAQAALVVVAVIWTRGRRFARPLPAPRVDRRSKLEFVASMAELQQRARAYDLAVENVYGRTRRALARYGGTTAAAPRQEIARRVAARSGRDEGEIEALMRECEDATAGERISARRTLALVAALRQLERDLGITMRAREIRQKEKGKG